MTALAQRKNLPMKTRPSLRAALKALAAYKSTHAGNFARDGDVMLSPADRVSRVQAESTVTLKLLALSDQPRPNVSYDEFRALMNELLNLGAYPAELLVADVEHAIHCAARVRSR